MFQIALSVGPLLLSRLLAVRHDHSAMLPTFTSQSFRFPSCHGGRPRLAAQSINCVAAPPVRDVLCIGRFGSMRFSARVTRPRRDHVLSKPIFDVPVNLALTAWISEGLLVYFK